MSKLIGQDVQVAVSKESSRGTAVAPSTGDFIRWGELTINNLQENIITEVNLGHIFTEGQQLKSKVGYEIEIKMPLEDVNIGKYLMAMFGTVTTTTDTPESGVNTHAFTINDSSLSPTYTLTVLWDSTQVQFVNGVLVSMSISSPARDKKEVSLKFRVKQYASTSGITASYSTVHYFGPCELSVYEASNYSGLGSATAGDATSVEVSFERELKELETVSSCDVDDLLGTGWNFQVNYEKNFDTSDSDLSDSEGVTSKAFRLVFEDTRDTIGSSSHPKLTIDIPSGVKTEFNRDIALKEVVGSKFNVKPDAQDLTNGYALANLINTESGY